VLDTLERLGVQRPKVAEAVTQNQHDYISTSYFLLHTKRSSYQSDALSHSSQCPCLDRIPPSRDWLQQAMNTAALDDNNPYSLRLLDTKGGKLLSGKHVPLHPDDMDEDESSAAITKNTLVPKLRYLDQNGETIASSSHRSGGTPRESPRPLSAPPTSTGNTPRIIGSQNPTPKISVRPQDHTPLQSTSTTKPTTPTSEEIRQAYFQAIPVT